MLFPADLGLTRRESHLPALAVALDPEALLTRLRQAMPDLNATDVQLAYVRYKPGTSCLVGGHLHAAGEVTPFHVTAFRPGSLKVAAQEKVRAATGQAPLVLDGGLLVYTPFPFDRKLRTLPLLADPGHVGGCWPGCCRTCRTCTGPRSRCSATSLKGAL
ncbi:hypothetical protein ACFSC4_24955 [Deinococcus malanensis]|uniref:hypothetical protein n=1 Tax=Deinococcus malanensis TaxID=1706855 RepID=UPI0036331E87